MSRTHAAFVMLGSIMAHAALLICTLGCDPAPPSSTEPASPNTVPRIVSLSPALTSTIVALGEGEALVGRTPWCRAAPRSVAVAWDGSSIDAEQMIALKPTLIIYQQTENGGPRDEIARLARGRSWHIASWRLDRLVDVRDMIQGVGALLGDRGENTAQDLLHRFDRACAPDANAAALGPALLLFATDPPMAFGPGSYVDDLWRALGGSNVIDAGAYPELTVEQMARIDPGWVIVIGSDQLLRAAQRLPVAALREGRIIHAADPGLLEPGAAVIPAIESLRRALADAVSKSRSR